MGKQLSTAMFVVSISKWETKQEKRISEILLEPSESEQSAKNFDLPKAKKKLGTKLWKRASTMSRTRKVFASDFCGWSLWTGNHFLCFCNLSKLDDAFCEGNAMKIFALIPRSANCYYLFGSRRKNCEKFAGTEKKFTRLSPMFALGCTRRSLFIRNAIGCWMKLVPYAKQRNACV